MGGPEPRARRPRTHPAAPRLGTARPPAGAGPGAAAAAARSLPYCRRQAGAGAAGPYIPGTPAPVRGEGGPGRCGGGGAVSARARRRRRSGDGAAPDTAEPGGTRRAAAAGGGGGSTAPRHATPQRGRDVPGSGMLREGTGGGWGAAPSWSAGSLTPLPHARASRGAPGLRGTRCSIGRPAPSEVPLPRGPCPALPCRTLPSRGSVPIAG